MVLPCLFFPGLCREAWLVLSLFCNINKSSSSRLHLSQENRERCHPQHHGVIGNNLVGMKNQRMTWQQYPTGYTILRVKVIYLIHKEGKFFWQDPGSRIEVVFQRKQILHGSHCPAQCNFTYHLCHAWENNGQCLKATKNPHWSLMLEVNCYIIHPIDRHSTHCFL